MENPIRADIVRLFRSNPLLRDTPEVIAARVGRAVDQVRKALDELEAEGVVAARWLAGSPLYFFTGSPNPAPATAAKVKTAVDQHPSEAVPVSDAPLQALLAVPSTVEGIGTGRSAVEGLCQSCGMDRSRRAEFAIAISEALTNAYRYGRRGDGRDRILIHFVWVDREVRIRVKDRGSGFPSLLVGAAHGDVQSTGGRGLMLMRSLSDSVEIRRSATGTTVLLVKRMQPEETPAA